METICRPSCNCLITSGLIGGGLMAGGLLASGPLYSGLIASDLLGRWPYVWVTFWVGGHMASGLFVNEWNQNSMPVRTSLAVSSRWFVVFLGPLVVTMLSLWWKPNLNEFVGTTVILASYLGWDSRWRISEFLSQGCVQSDSRVHSCLIHWGTTA